jgi:protein-S-isoprenylcysteine O-methyltransferase Ste14
VTRPRAVAITAIWFVVAGGIGAVLIPWWLTGLQVQHPLPAAVQAIGFLFVASGLFVTVHVFAQFVRASGSPMPGAMTARLVVTGLNRYVRNPIYLGVVAILLGEALILGSPRILVYALLAWAGCAVFVRYYEEPALARRFGNEYETYRREVNAWLPRIGRGSATDRTAM